MEDVKVIVATHKEYAMPTDDFYLPLQVGTALHGKLSGYQSDDTGKNISKKNNSFCELTGLYWAWQNLGNKYVGLAHYRRLFKITPEKLVATLKENDIILPKKRYYVIDTIYNHYAHTLYSTPLDLTGEVIKEKCPEYYREFQKLKHRRSAHMFNMCIMKKELFDAYCDWLFEILFELERYTKYQKYDAFHARFYGRISELLLDVFIRTNHLRYTEIPVKNTEKINWLKKGASFLGAKLFGRKYHESF